MPFCSNCGHPLTQADKFCSGCGAATDMDRRSVNRVPTYFIVSAILVLLLLVVLYFIPNDFSKGQSNSSTQTKVSDTNIENKTSVSSDGKLTFVTDVYVIVTGSYEKLDNVRSEVSSLRSRGEIAGYFWRPDFPSLEGKPLYSTFIGFFETYADCESKLRSLQQSHTDYYGLKLSRSTERVKIR